MYHWTHRLRDGFVDRLVTDETDLCVEGFPRSANSFAVGAVDYAQPEPLSIAHHNHVPAPLLNAARRGLPAVGRPWIAAGSRADRGGEAVVAGT